MSYEAIKAELSFKFLKKESDKKFKNIDLSKSYRGLDIKKNTSNYYKNSDNKGINSEKYNIFSLEFGKNKNELELKKEKQKKPTQTIPKIKFSKLNSDKIIYSNIIKK